VKHTQADVELLRALGHQSGDYERDLQIVARFRDKAEHEGLIVVEQAVEDANKRVTSNTTTTHEMSWTIYVAALINRQSSVDSACAIADKILAEQKIRFKKRLE